jgi:hypothetical protein
MMATHSGARLDHDAAASTFKKIDPEAAAKAGVQ